jgi:molybdate transport system substrate-binding protein
VRIILRLIIFSIFLTLKYSLANAGYTNSITILAPDSMTSSLIEISRNYSRKSSKNVSLIFDNNKRYIKLIEDGNPADIIITNHPSWINNLKLKGLIDVNSISNLVEDSFVLVMNKEFYDVYSKQLNSRKNHASSWNNFLINNFKLAIINPQLDPTSNSALSTLKNANINFKSENIIYSNDLNQELNESSDIIVMAPLSLLHDRQDLNIIKIFPSETDERFIYQAALIASENMKESDKLLQYIKSDKTKEIFRKHGFKIIK